MLGTPNASASERRTRKSHRKVRTGCLTCKIRKKKCDEAKPACLRCVTTGRCCDGYKSSTISVSSATPNDERSDSCANNERSTTCLTSFDIRPVSATVTPLSIPQRMTQVMFADQIEARCFDYFRNITGPQFDSYFDNSIFASFTVKALMFEPVVLKAAAALGAVHRRFDLGLTREAFEYCAISARLQREALKAYSGYCRTVTSNLPGHEIHMVTAMLFGHFETFQGNHDIAVKHIARGLEHLWSRPTKVLYSQSEYRNNTSESGVLLQHFQKLEACATKLFGHPPRVLASFLSHSLPSMPLRFSSLQEAMDLLFTEVDCILHTPIGLWLNADMRAKAQHLHVSRILQWNAAYANTLKQMPNRTSTQIRVCRLLKLTKSSMYLLLYLVLFMLDDQVHANTVAKILPQLNLIFNDDYTISAPSFTTNKSQDIFATTTLLQHLISSHEDLSTNLARLCMLADSFLDETSPFNYVEHSINFDSGIGPPRLAHPGPNSSAKTRHLIKSLLNTKTATNNRNIDQNIDDELLLTSLSSATNSPSVTATRPASTTTAIQPITDNNDLAHPLGAYTIAEHLSSIEEHAVLVASRHLIRSHLNTTDTNTKENTIKWIDATCFLEEGKVLVRHCRYVDHMDSDIDIDVAVGDGGVVNDDDGRKGGLIWTQEWLKFVG